jgi:hypothetical protein
MMKQVNKLAFILGAGGLNGAVSLAALSGLFRAENAFSLAVLFMAGPGAIMTAMLLDGAVKERLIAALLAGVIATIIVALAAGLGPELLKFTNLAVLKVIGGIAVLAIGLLIMGVRMPESVPTIIMIAGLLASVIMR